MQKDNSSQIIGKIPSSPLKPVTTCGKSSISGVWQRFEFTFVAVIYVNELSHILVPVPTKIVQLVAGISWKSANYLYKPKLYYLLPVFFLSFFVSLWHCSHMSLSYLSSDDGLNFFLFFVLWGLRVVVS